MTKSTELALQLKDLEIAFPFGWISTNRRVTCLVSQGFVDLVDQPGEGAAVDGLGQGVPGVGGLLQVQGADQLQAGAEKSHSAAPQTKGSPFPVPSLLKSHSNPSCSWLSSHQWDPCSDNLL